MENEELQIMLKNRMKNVKEILELHEEGKTSNEISVKVRVAESYIIHVLKNGYDNMLSEISRQYNILPELEQAKEKSSLKKIDKVDKPHPSTNQELLCMDCVQVLQQIDAVVFNDYVFRMYKCPKCGKAYPHPLDSQGYLGKDST